MVERKGIILALGYVGALAWAVYEWQRPAPTARAPQPTAAIELPRLSPPKTSLGTLDTFDEIIERPLFASKRRPLKDGGEASNATKDDSTADNTAGSLTESRLSAILVDGNEVTALVERGDGSTTTLQKGGTFEGWQVNDIQDDHIILRLEDHSRRLLVHRFDTPPARATSPAKKQPKLRGRRALGKRVPRAALRDVPKAVDTRARPPAPRDDERR